MRRTYLAIAIGVGITLVVARPGAADLPAVTRSEIGVIASAEREVFLRAHNAARSVVGVGPVTWSEDVALYALDSLVQQKEALIRKASDGWEKGTIALPVHRSEGKYGENLAGWMGPGRGSTASGMQGPEFAVQLWLREKAAFDQLNAKSPYRVGDEKVDLEPEQLGDDKQEKQKPIVVGHYTQIVWRETQRIGAAKLSFELMDEKGNSRSYVAVICNYDPPGNRIGKKPF